MTRIPAAWYGFWQADQSLCPSGSNPPQAAGLDGYLLPPAAAVSPFLQWIIVTASTKFQTTELH